MERSALRVAICHECQNYLGGGGGLGGSEKQGTCTQTLFYFSFRPLRSMFRFRFRDCVSASVSVIPFPFPDSGFHVFVLP